MGARYAKDNIYADVQEEGGTIRRLVAVKGKPVPAPYADYVDDADTTTDVDEAHELALERHVEPVTETAPNLPSTSDGSAAGPGDASPEDPEPFEGYDALNAKEVAAKLRDLTPDELAAVKAYEAAHKDRSTITGYEAPASS